MSAALDSVIAEAWTTAAPGRVTRLRRTQANTPMTAAGVQAVEVRQEAQHRLLRDLVGVEAGEPPAGQPTDSRVVAAEDVVERALGPLVVVQGGDGHIGVLPGWGRRDTNVRDNDIE